MARLTCLCGRSFELENALSYHQRACVKTIKHTKSILAKAKAVWKAREEDIEVQASAVNAEV